MAPVRSPNRYQYLASKWRSGTLTPEEEQEFFGWLNVYQDTPIEIPPHLAKDEAELKAHLLNKINEAIAPLSKLKPQSPAITYLRAAAVWLIILGAAFTCYRILWSETPATTTFAAGDIAAGGNKAFLHLADGRRIDLSQARNGTLAKQAGIAIEKMADGQLVYHLQEKNRGRASAALNTLETPRGGQYQIILPDGSHVWLNAASKLSYPASFEGSERSVTLTGEAYFEVAHNVRQPFIVRSAGQSVKVLGTHFNVMAYPNEDHMQTTLLQGSVSIRKGEQIAIIRPGQQATVRETVEVGPADTDAAVAWKEGKTYFRDADIPTMLRSLSRWYNIEVVFEGPVPQRLFTGGISRKANLSEMLRILELNGIHAKLEDHKLIIRP